MIKDRLLNKDFIEMITCNNCQYLIERINGVIELTKKIQYDYRGNPYPHVFLGVVSWLYGQYQYLLGISNTNICKGRSFIIKSDSVFPFLQQRVNCKGNIRIEKYLIQKNEPRLARAASENLEIYFWLWKNRSNYLLLDDYFRELELKHHFYMSLVGMSGGDTIPNYIRLQGQLENIKRYGLTHLLKQ